MQTEVNATTGRAALTMPPFAAVSSKPPYRMPGWFAVAAAVFFSAAAFAGNEANPDAVELAPLPTPAEFKSDMDRPVPFDASTTVAVECPDAKAAEWLATHFKEWYGDQSPKVQSSTHSSQLPTPNSQLSTNLEAYVVRADGSGVRIAANALAGVRWAAYTLRQLAIAKRGTLMAEGRILPSLQVADRPHLAFRAVHLCWFPEVRSQQIERAIRLAALLKFNYAIIEPWGMYASESNPWWHWPNPRMTKTEVRRLVEIGRDLGITLIPQINAYGHASSARGGSMKHVVMDLKPAYEPLFEPGGWNWCLSNPAAQRALRELIAEMHDDFGRPPFFHLGCDEAQPPSCPECRRTPYAELVCRHITGLAEFVKQRGARAMIWHDMLLARGDPRWKGYVHSGSKATAALADTLPKDVIICDWQYSYGDMKEERKDWPTMAYFREKGFPVVGCPWMNYNAMKPMADYIASIGGFGLIETTWHHLRGGDWVYMYKFASAAAWGTAVSPRGAAYDTVFGMALRLVGHDMKVTDYIDTGHQNYQVPPAWWMDN